MFHYVFPISSITEVCSTTVQQPNSKIMPPYEQGNIRRVRSVWGDRVVAFDCEDSQADVCFVTRGHRVVCKQCARSTFMRRGPLCYQFILKAISDVVEVQIGSVLSNAAAAAKQAKLDAEREKLRELEKLREKLMETSCTTCTEARPSIVFNCGHTVCSDYTTLRMSCHIWRATVIDTLRIQE
ncbi:unnamed protein product [Heligmosomoides polygyrus]|uniref:Zn_Tnp_IS91 domain-containing protein n=1 Tax=Heligmosomoides polygyrus TaxID=6339 RepID=A0A183GW91_HELPZ|nr:unnamed protein product [Heligmosomoides polygyrus]